MGWDGAVVPFTSYETMAAHYADETRKLQPQGPYYLGGYSFGGRVAVYVARHLKAAGEEVALLALLDPYSSSGRQWMTLGQWLERCGQPTGPQRLAKAADYLWFRVRRARRFFHGHVRRAVLFTIWGYYRRTGKTLPFSLRRPNHANRLIRMMRGPMPPYDGDATYFRANFNPTSRAHTDSQSTWSEMITGQLTSIPLACTHSQVIEEPYVRTVARELRQALERARTRVA